MVLQESPMVFHCHPWALMGFQWTCMSPHRCPRASIVRRWASMGLSYFSESLRWHSMGLPLASVGSHWSPIDVHGRPWIPGRWPMGCPMGDHGRPPAAHGPSMALPVGRRWASMELPLGSHGAILGPHGIPHTFLGGKAQYCTPPAQKVAATA